MTTRKMTWDDTLFHLNIVVMIDFLLTLYMFQHYMKNLNVRYSVET